MLKQYYRSEFPSCGLASLRQSDTGENRRQDWTKTCCNRQRPFPLTSTAWSVINWNRSPGFPRPSSPTWKQESTSRQVHMKNKIISAKKNLGHSDWRYCHHRKEQQTISFDFSLKISCSASVLVEYGISRELHKRTVSSLRNLTGRKPVRATYL